MNKILEIEEPAVSSPQISMEHEQEKLVTRAKITGPICVGFAVATIFPGILSTYVYFTFLFLAAFFGLLAYTEACVKKKGLISSSMLLFSFVLIIMLFLSFPLTLNSWNFRVFYGLLAILVPVLLASVAGHRQRGNIWKTLVPLLLPIFFIADLVAAAMNMFLVSFLLPPLGWGVVGVAAFLGNGEKR